MMAKNRHKLKHHKYAKQAGFVMIITMLALVIMLLASVALIKSTQANLEIAGNMAFKRDLINQAERMIPDIQAKFKATSLASESSRENDNAANNYSATILPANDSGIPQVLIDMSDSNANNIKPTDGSGVLIRYVIDRMCLSNGKVDVKYCTLAVSNESPGGPQGPPGAGGVRFPVYRITIRATGPRNTEAYMQTTYSD